MSSPLTLVPAVVVVLGASVAAGTDIWKFRVPNLLTLPLIVTGLGYHGLTEGWSGFGESLTGALFGFSVLFLFFLMGGMGGGDVKLMMAVGAWLGVGLAFWVFIFSSIAAGIYALVLILTRGSYRTTWVNLRICWYRFMAIQRHLAREDLETVVDSPARRRQCIPFAAMVALGIFGTLLMLIVRTGQ